MRASGERSTSSIRYTERLAEAGIEPSVGSVGDSYDNALAETINGLYKTEVIHRCGPWRSFEAVEIATLEWVDWFNNRRLLDTHRQHSTRRSSWRATMRRSMNSIWWPGSNQTIRTSRAQTSEENLFLVLLIMASLSQELEPPPNPVRFNRGRSTGCITAHTMVLLFFLTGAQDRSL